MTAVALIAGGSIATSLVLAVAMLAVQFSIGVTNDVFDQEADAGRADKPLVTGAIARRTAIAAAAGLGAAGLAVATTQGLFELGLLSVMYGAGLSYDAGLKRLGLGWVAYAVAFPLLPVYAWHGATGTWPPHAAILLPIAALAGPALALANALVDDEQDAAAGARTVVVRLGRGASIIVMVLLVLVIHSVAWSTAIAAGGAPPSALAAMGAASLLAGIGIALTTGRWPELRERGWQAQAVAIVLLAAGWFVSVVLPAR